RSTSPLRCSRSSADWTVLREGWRVAGILAQMALASWCGCCQSASSTTSSSSPRVLGRMFDDERFLIMVQGTTVFVCVLMRAHNSTTKPSHEIHVACCEPPLPAKGVNGRAAGPDAAWNLDIQRLHVR